MKKAGQYSGFEILDIVPLEEMNATGIWARHHSGAELFHILNDDPENLFAFAFATAPEDSTGVAHILEHSVLCGSQKYPLKDAFLVLAQGSLQTFLNAWTFPDKTLYPASSVNEQDYFNLMSVYADAVFHPLLPEWVFMQEGHRLFLVPQGDRLALSGVVYNEMKGAYSALDTYAALWSVKALLPGTPYEHESGGDPEHIPDLTWEGLLAFHRARYCPANCRIFLAGNIPTEKQLAFLDKILGGCPPGKAAARIEPALRWKEGQTFRIPCPAGADTKPTVMLSWLCTSDPADSREILALACLGEILLGHDGSPLTKALIESGLGEDLSPSTGLETDLLETIFSAGLRGLNEGVSPEDVEALVIGELERLVSQGIDEKEVEAALLGMEFSQREIRRSGGPYSLVWLQKSLRGWLHGARPWERLLFKPPFDELKKRLKEKGYLESLIKTYFLDNPHRALLILQPEEGFLAEKEEKLEKRLAEKAAALSPQEKAALAEKATALEAVQSGADSAEALAAIPHISRKDLDEEAETIDRHLYDERGIPVLGHGLHTNGIGYADLAFPVDVLEPEDYPWLPLFGRVINSLGLPGMDYAEVSSLLARTAGGFSVMLNSGSPAPGVAASVALPGGIFDIRGRDWIVYRIKALDEKLKPSLELARRLIVEADFSDTRRIRDLVLEMKNDIDSGLAPMGHSFAGGRSGRLFSRSRRVSEIWNGLVQIPFAHRLVELDTPETAARLRGIRDRLCGGGLIVNYTGTGNAAFGEVLAEFGPPRSRNRAHEKDAAYDALLNGDWPRTEGPEVFAASSLQIGFASMSLPASVYDSPEHAAELVFSHELSTGALWEGIRMKGGAYGAFASTEALEGSFTFSTYRDPDPLRSLEVFPSILKELAGRQTVDGGELEKIIIGTYARETHPQTPSAKGFSDFLRFISGVSNEQRSRKLRRIINCRGEDLVAAAARLSACKARSPVIIAGTAVAEKAAASLGVQPVPLPL